MVDRAPFVLGPAATCPTKAQLLLRLPGSYSRSPLPGAVARPVAIGAEPSGELLRGRETRTYSRVGVREVVSDLNCPKCGGPNPPGATVCQWCTSALSQPAPPPPTLEYHPIELDAPERPSPFTPGVIAGLVALVIVVIIIVAVAASLQSASAPSSGSGVQVTGLRVVSGDDACGLNGDDSGTYQSGGQVSSGYQGPPIITWGVPGPSGTVPCTVSSVSTNTPGFELSASLPQTVTSTPSVLVVSVLVEPSSFHGVLNVTFG